MPINPNRKARTRQEILDHAARLFRLRGFETTTIDDVMLAAGLTRGAFDAHFGSKDELFAEVLRASDGLLRARTGEDPRALGREAARAPRLRQCGLCVDCRGWAWPAQVQAA